MKAAIQSFFLKIVIHLYKYTWGIPVRGIISSEAAGCMSAVLVKVGSFAGAFQVFCLFYYFYCVNGCFGGTNPGGSLIILSTLFILILHERIIFWRALFAVGFLINNWYCVSCLLNINSVLALYRGFLHRWLIHWRDNFINLQFL